MPPLHLRELKTSLSSISNSKMKVLYKIAFKFLLVFVILLVSNKLYTHFLLESDIQKHTYREIVDVIPHNSEIVYFGESSNYSTYYEDKDKRSISEYIANYFPTKRFGTVHKGALHARIYKYLMRQFPEQNDIETIIVTLNLRSFSANWIYSDLETALDKSVVLLKQGPALKNRFLLSFKGYDIKTKAQRKDQFKRNWEESTLKFPWEFPHLNVNQWDKVIYKKGIRNPDGTKDWETSALACHYIKSYAFQIDTQSNPRIKDFDDIAEYAASKGWNVIFNLLAENIDKAEELVGNELLFLMRQNRDLLVKRYQKKGVIVVDNLEKVDSLYFRDKDWTTEHYWEEGRRIIAKNIADSLRSLYTVDYTKLENEERSWFFHDAGTKEHWGQSRSITSEQAYSGDLSSKVCDSLPYSLTMEWPLKQIPKTNLNTLRFEAMAFANSLNNKARVVVEANGLKQNYRAEEPLESYILKEHNWREFSIEFLLPDNISEYKNIKVYIYNPSKEAVFIDDIDIRFFNSDNHSEKLK